MTSRKPHPKNVPGDFYVENECCVLCGVPQEIAPDLFSPLDEDGEHCFVRAQPETPDQVQRIIEVIQAAEYRCIRYAGKDVEIRKRIRDVGAGEVCDDPRSGSRKS